MGRDAEGAGGTTMTGTTPIAPVIRWQHLFARSMGMLSVVAMAVGIGSSSSAAAWRGPSPVGRVSVAGQAGITVPKLDCAALNPIPLGGNVVVGPGSRPQPGVPDFKTIREAPTRITRATLVPVSGQ